MSTRTIDSTPRPATSRRAFLRSVAGGAALTAMLAAGRAADAIGPRPNREHGTSPGLVGVQPFSGAGEAQAPAKRFERRTPD